MLGILEYWQLLNNGEQGEKNYTSVVPWMESLLFAQSANQPRGGARDHEVSGEWIDHFIPSHKTAYRSGMPFGDATSGVSFGVYRSLLGSLFRASTFVP